MLDGSNEINWKAYSWTLPVEGVLGFFPVTPTLHLDPGLSGEGLPRTLHGVRMIVYVIDT